MTLEIKVYDEQNLKWMTARKSPNFESIVNRLGALAAKVSECAKAPSSVSSVYHVDYRREAR